MGFLRLNNITCEHKISLSLFAATLIYNYASITDIPLIILTLYITYYYGDFIYRSCLTLRRDLTGLCLLLRVRFDLNRRLRENRGIHELFLDVVKKNKDKTAVIDVHTGRKLTFNEFNQLANRFANYFKV